MGDQVSGAVEVVTRQGKVFFNNLSLGEGGGSVALAGLCGVVGRKNLAENGSYETESRHRLRVVGFSLIDHILLLSAKKSVLKQQFVMVQVALSLAPILKR